MENIGQFLFFLLTEIPQAPKENFGRAANRLLKKRHPLAEKSILTHLCGEHSKNKTSVH